MPIASIAGSWYIVAPALIALFGVLVTLIVAGIRAERQRRRDLHARALAAITAYGEMPYRIRRRAPGPEARSRLSDDLSHVKAEVDTCQVLLAADGNEAVADVYDDLYALARRTVGNAAHEAWRMPPIDMDSEMNLGSLNRDLAQFNEARNAFADDLRAATLPLLRRLSRAARARWPWLARIPGVRAPKPASSRITRAPQDVPSAGAAADDAQSPHV